MAVRKTGQTIEGQDIYEDIIEQPPKIIRFTLPDLKTQISNEQKKVDTLTTRETAAKALPK